jgi:hypothetical protein
VNPWSNVLKIEKFILADLILIKWL